MRRAYLFDQPVTDAEQMDVGRQWFLDMPGSARQQLSRLLDAGGLRDGDVLVVSARSKLGKGAEARRIMRKLDALGVSLDVRPVVRAQPKRRGKRRKIDDAERQYGRAIWLSSQPQRAALAAISKRVGFEVDRNWCNYHLGVRSPSTDHS